MLKKLKKLARTLFPNKLVRLMENFYRRSRARLYNMRYGVPGSKSKVIMITGTNGKTTTAHFLFSILRSAGKNVGLISTAEFRFNDEMTKNDTNMTVVEPGLLRRRLASFTDKGADYIILEATSQSLDQDRLFGIKCDVAIFTNLTQDHLDYHGTMDCYAAAKAKLWHLNPQLSVLNADSDWFDYFETKVRSGELVTYGHSSGDVRFDDYRVSRDQVTEFDLCLDKQKVRLTTKLTGEYNAYNATAASAAAFKLGVDTKSIQEGVSALDHLAGRMEYVEVNKPFDVVVDYAHTPDGIEKLLAAANDMTKGRVWLVFGSCGDRDASKRPIMGEVAARMADKIVLTDEESYSEQPAEIIKQIKVGIDKVKGSAKKTEVILDRRQAIKYALDNAQKGDLVLVTGLGHEQFRIQAGKRIPWHDPTVIKELASS